MIGWNWFIVVVMNKLNWVGFLFTIITKVEIKAIISILFELVLTCLKILKDKLAELNLLSGYYTWMGFAQACHLIVIIVVKICRML